jgi:vacuolar-type H+-ATPase subunit H
MNQEHHDIINQVRGSIKHQNQGYERFFDASREARESRREVHPFVKHATSTTLNELESIILAGAKEIRQWAAKYISEVLQQEILKAQGRLDSSLHGVCDSKLREMEHRVTKELRAQLDKCVEQHVRGAIGQMFNQLKYPGEFDE